MLRVPRFEWLLTAALTLAALTTARVAPSPGATTEGGGSACAWSGQGTFEAGDPQYRSEFGIALAMSGNTAVVGAPRDGEADSGAAYVFQRTGSVWAEVQKLTPPDPRASDLFGNAVAIFDETIVVGRIKADFVYGSNVGSAFVYVKSGETWVQRQVLTASDGSAADDFGSAVAIHDDLIVVGAQRDDAGASDSGSAYVFARQGSSWSEQEELVPGNPTSIGNIGSALDVFEETVILCGNGSPSAYVFERDGTGWPQTQELSPSSASFTQASVAMAQDVAVIGVSTDDHAGPDSGSAFVLERNGSAWVETAQLTASDAEAGDFFGLGVSILGNTILVGAPVDRVAGVNSGSTYVFERTGSSWNETQRLVPANGSAQAQFGRALALSSKVALVGAPYGTATVLQAGSFHAFGRQGASLSGRSAAPNPNSYSCTYPVVGATWTASVDLSSGGHSHAQVLGFAAPAATVLTGGQVLLVGGNQLMKLPLRSGPLASWTVPLPGDCTLAGLSVYTQAVHLLGVSPFALSNSQDLVLGY